MHDDFSLCRMPMASINTSSNICICASSGSWKLCFNSSWVYIIDYLTLYTDHYRIGAHINRIFKKLNGKGVAVIGLQLPQGRDYGVGGESSLDIACLYVLLRKGEMTLRKVKDFKTTRHPEGQTMPFKLWRGCAFSPQSEWDIGEPYEPSLEEEEDDIPWVQ